MRGRFETAHRWRPDIKSQQAARLAERMEQVNAARIQEPEYHVYSAIGTYMGKHPERVALSLVRDHQDWTLAPAK